MNTSDPVDRLGNRGRWTLHNSWLACRHLAEAARRSFRRDVGAVYVPIAQEFPALVRDMAFLLIARLARLPAIVHLHGGKFGDYYASRPRAVRVLLRATIGGAARGIVLTESLRPALECILPAGRVSVVANGIDLPSPAGRVRSDGTVEILFLSSLFPWKGPLVFIDAFSRARRQYPSLHATVAGDWPTDEVHADALRLVEELGVEQAVTFPGAVDREQKRELLEEADIFCFASLVPEGQPLVILEAMAARLPVIAPAWPGVADTVVDRETGLLVAEPSAAALADRLVELARDPDQRARLGAAGGRRYEQLFTQRAFGARMIEVLQPFLENGTPA